MGTNRSVPGCDVLCSVVARRLQSRRILLFCSFIRLYIMNLLIYFWFSISLSVPRSVFQFSSFNSYITFADLYLAVCQTSSMTSHSQSMCLLFCFSCVSATVTVNDLRLYQLRISANVPFNGPSFNYNT